MDRVQFDEREYIDAKQGDSEDVNIQSGIEDISQFGSQHPSVKLFALGA